MIIKLFLLFYITINKFCIEWLFFRPALKIFQMRSSHAGIFVEFTYDDLFFCNLENGHSPGLSFIRQSQN